MKKIDIELVKDLFEKENYILLNDVYVNAKDKLKCICPMGHLYITSWSNWKRGSRCAKCHGNIKYTYEEVKIKFEAEGYTLLSTTYKNISVKLKYKCSNDHYHSITLRDWNSGHRCPYCNGRPILTIDDVRTSMECEGYRLLTTVYYNNKTTLECVCPEGHVFFTNWAKWHSHKYRCPYCYGNVKKTINDIKENVEFHGYKLITDQYTNCYKKLHLICPNGHDYYVSWDNWNSKSSRCPKCNKVGTSIQENNLINFIHSVYDDEVINNNYDIIPPLELDIVLPDIKLAIEYCGIYWHSELMGKSKSYHLNKLDRCNDKGFKLLTIFEDELLFKEDILKSVLKNKLGVFDGNKVYARKCKVQEISTKLAREFCEQNHLQGYAGSSIKLGLFHEEELVSVMTFSKLSIAKGRKHTEGGWELSRFCNKINYSVVGGASKLLKYFENNYICNELISYADRRWSDGNMYYKLGFDFEKFTQPNYWYFNGSDPHRIHRFALRKKSNEPKNITEWEIRKSQGYNRVWDCGNLRFIQRNRCVL